MKQRRAFLAASVVFVAMMTNGCASNSEAVSDCFITRQYKKLALPVCASYVMNVASGDSGRMDIYCNLPYRRLHFEKNERGFTASYTFSAVLRSENDDVLQTKDVQRSIIVPTYNESVSPRADAFLLTVPLPAADSTRRAERYTLETNVVDDGSGLRYSERQEITARNFHRVKISASDFLLLENAVRDTNGISLRPAFPSLLSQFAGSKDSLGIFQEVYNVHRGDSLRASFSYRVARTALPHLYSYAELTALGYFQQFSPCSLKFDSTVYHNDSLFVASTNLPAGQAGGTVQLIQFYPKPPQRYVDIVRTIVRTHEGKSDSTVNSLRVFVSDPSFPDVTAPAELAEAMLFLARGSEIDSLVRASDMMARHPMADSVRLRVIGGFWKRHGGGERMQMFQQRLREANELFTACMEGWKTPMGIVYLVCGPPEAVDCQASLNEMWYYSAGNSTLAIPFQRVPSAEGEPVFYDLAPYSINDYLWQYFVDRWR
ncbi:MAG: GWxTD domain-containing protein [Bacteroidota bacterium]|nr:GWxTD domain-containing protein [Bacteroidota bacterium]